MRAGSKSNKGSEEPVRSGQAGSLCQGLLYSAGNQAEKISAAGLEAERKEIPFAHLLCIRHVFPFPSLIWSSPEVDSMILRKGN